MKEPVSGWKVLGAFIVTMGALVAMWMSLSGQIKQDGRDFENHEQRIRSLEENKREFKEQIQRLDEKLDKVSDQNTQILIILQNKQDRKQ